MSHLPPPPSPARVEADSNAAKLTIPYLGPEPAPSDDRGHRPADPVRRDGGPLHDQGGRVRLAGPARTRLSRPSDQGTRRSGPVEQPTSEPPEHDRLHRRDRAHRHRFVLARPASTEASPHRTRRGLRGVPDQVGHADRDAIGVGRASQSAPGLLFMTGSVNRLNRANRLPVAPSALGPRQLGGSRTVDLVRGMGRLGQAQPRAARRVVDALPRRPLAGAVLPARRGHGVVRDRPR